jgi:hypothetical protein
VKQNAAGLFFRLGRRKEGRRGQDGSGVVVGSDKKSGTAGVVVRIGSFLLARVLFTFEEHSLV